MTKVPGAPFVMREALADDFNRTNANPIGSPWITQLTDGLQLVSNAVQGITLTVLNSAYHGGITWPANQWAMARVSGTDANSDMGVAVRMQAGAKTFYDLHIDVAGGVSDIAIWNAGVFTSLLDLGTTFTTGDRAMIWVHGSTLYAFKNDVFLNSINDTTLTSGSPGLDVISNMATTNWDDFYAGDFNYQRGLEVSASPTVASVQMVAGY